MDFEALADSAFSIFKAAKDSPNGVALRIDGKNYTFSHLASCVLTWKSNVSLPKIGRPLMMDATNTLDTFIAIYGALEYKIPLLLLHPSLTDSERHARHQLFESIKEPLDQSIAVVMLTSGTSGIPKPAKISRRALAASAHSSACNIPLTESDRWLMSLSCARIGGFSILTRSLMARSTVVLAKHFSSETFCQAINVEKITLASIVPTMLSKLLDEQPLWKPHNGFRAILLGGASATSKLLASARQKGYPIVTTYGMTETTSNIVTTPYEQRYNLNAQSRPNPFVNLKIENETIHVRGPMLMSGYWGQNQFQNINWFDTGDIGFIDKNGNIQIYSRRTDLIVTGGENVYPSEVENALESIAGIKKALVIGLPDETWGSIVTALLVPTLTPINSDLLKIELRKRLSTFKCPRRIAWVQELPTKDSGKLDRSSTQISHKKLETLHYKR